MTTDSSERRHSISVCQSPVTSDDSRSQFDSDWSQVDKFRAVDFSKVVSSRQLIVAYLSNLIKKFAKQSIGSSSALFLS